MAILLVQSTVFLGSCVQNETAATEHSCSDTEGRQEGSSVAEAGPLQTRRVSTETCLPCWVPGFKRPTQLFYRLRCFIWFPYQSTRFIPILEAAWNVVGFTACSSSTTGFSIHWHRPGLAWQSHLHCTAHPPACFTLHDLAAKKNRKGTFTNIWNAISVIN